MKLIVGLGNPGTEYEKTRHNAGFMVVDELRRRWNLPEFKARQEAEISKGEEWGESIILLKPQTFMNLSGDAVAEAVSFYKIETTEGLWVIHDEIDLPLGTVRVQKNVSAAGHNGVKSIIERIGHRDFVRFRVGVGRPVGPLPVEDYVLRPFDGSERAAAEAAVKKAADAVEKALKDGLTTAMNTYNG